jgi:hypothetical protein
MPAKGKLTNKNPFRRMEKQRSGRVENCISLADAFLAVYVSVHSVLMFIC